MTNIRCVNAGSYRLTVGREYPLLRQNEEFYFLNNDNGTSVKYAKRYFEEVPDPETTRRRTPPRTVANVIASIRMERDAIVFENINNEARTLTNPLAYNENMNISCGTAEVYGIDSLLRSIRNLFDDEDDYIEEKKAVLRRALTEWIINRPGKAMRICSTTMRQDEDMLSVFTELAGATTDARVNPNSGNQIKVWIFFVEPQATGSEDDDEDFDDDEDDD